MLLDEVAGLGKLVHRPVQEECRKPAIATWGQMAWSWHPLD
jgi:hypothetical protein